MFAVSDAPICARNADHSAAARDELVEENDF
jgi:hypothetical protein